MIRLLGDSVSMNHASQHRMAKSEAGISERKTVNFHIAASDNPDQENEAFILNEESSTKSDNKDSKNNEARKNPFRIFNQRKRNETGTWWSFLSVSWSSMHAEKCLVC